MLQKSRQSLIKYINRFLFSLQLWEFSLFFSLSLFDHIVIVMLNKKKLSTIYDSHFQRIFCFRDA